jgi:HSP20 family protein
MLKDLDLLTEPGARGIYGLSHQGEEVTDRMAMLRWENPWSWLRDVEREMAQVTRRLFGPDFMPVYTGTSHQLRGWWPKMDVFSKGEDLIIRAELPGVDPEKDVEISYKEGALIIRGERRTEERTDDMRYHRVENTYGAFERTVSLPRGIQAEDIKATHKDGILEIVIPQVSQLTPERKIPVTAGSGQEIPAETTETQS